MLLRAEGMGEYVLFRILFSLWLGFFVISAFVGYFNVEAILVEEEYYLPYRLRD